MRLRERANWRDGNSTNEERVFTTCHGTHVCVRVCRLGLCYVFVSVSVGLFNKANPSSQQRDCTLTVPQFISRRTEMAGPIDSDYEANYARIELSSIHTVKPSFARRKEYTCSSVGESSTHLSKMAPSPAK